jgi:hypothetical protein
MKPFASSTTQPSSQRVSFEGDDLGAWPQYNRSSLFDSPNQVPGFLAGFPP